MKHGCQMNVERTIICPFQPWVMLDNNLYLTLLLIVHFSFFSFFSSRGEFSLQLHWLWESSFLSLVEATFFTALNFAAHRKEFLAAWFTFASGGLWFSERIESFSFLFFSDESEIFLPESPRCNTDDRVLLSLLLLSR